MTFPVATPIEKRNAALARAEVVGVMQAARECGVSWRALYDWRSGRPTTRARRAARQIVALADQLITAGADREQIIAQIEALARQRTKRPVGRPRLP